MELRHPLESSAAKRIVRDILENGNVIPTRHARDEMANDNLTLVDCVNVLRAGWVNPPEFENGAWRYRAQTNRIVVVIEIDDAENLTIITAWRLA